MLSTKYQWSIGRPSVACRLICQPTIHQHTDQHYRPTLGQLWLSISANMSTKSRSYLPGVGRYVDWYDDQDSVSWHISRHVDQVSANIVHWYSTEGFTNSHESDPNPEQTQPKIFSHGAPWGICLVWLHYLLCMQKSHVLWMEYKHVCVVVQFYPWFKFYFSLFWGMVMYDKEFKTKGN